MLRSADSRGSATRGTSVIRSRLPPMLDGPHDQPSGDQPGAFGTPDGEPPGDGLPGDVTPSRAPPPGGDQGEFSQRVSLFNTYALHARGVLEAVQNGTFSIAEQA